MAHPNVGASAPSREIGGVYMSDDEELDVPSDLLRVLPHLKGLDVERRPPRVTRFLASAAVATECTTVVVNLNQIQVLGTCFVRFVGASLGDVDSYECVLGGQRLNRYDIGHAEGARGVDEAWMRAMAQHFSVGYSATVLPLWGCFDSMRPLPTCREAGLMYHDFRVIVRLKKGSEARSRRSTVEVWGDCFPFASSVRPPSRCEVPVWHLQSCVVRGSEAATGARLHFRLAVKSILVQGVDMTTVKGVTLTLDGKVAFQTPTDVLRWSAGEEEFAAIDKWMRLTRVDDIRLTIDADVLPESVRIIAVTHNFIVGARGMFGLKFAWP